MTAPEPALNPTLAIKSSYSFSPSATPIHPKLQTHLQFIAQDHLSYSLRMSTCSAQGPAYGPVRSRFSRYTNLIHTTSQLIVHIWQEACEVSWHVPLIVPTLMILVLCSIFSSGSIKPSSLIHQVQPQFCKTTQALQSVHAIHLHIRPLFWLSCLG
jgi:hypothetical protein